MRVVIVDDEPLARRGLLARLRHVPDVTVVQEFANGADAVAGLRGLDVDLVFLDIHMPDMDGLQVAARLLAASVPPHVVFLTAHEEYALRAFEVQAFDYLLKPVDGDRLMRMLDRVRARLKETRPRSEHMPAVPKPEIVPSVQDSQPTFATQFVVRNFGRATLVAVNEIDWIESEGDYVRLHAGGRSHLLRQTLAETVARLDPRVFQRIHRSTAVNLQRIAGLRRSATGEYEVILKDTTQLRAGSTFRRLVIGLFDKARDNS